MVGEVSRRCSFYLCWDVKKIRFSSQIESCHEVWQKQFQHNTFTCNNFEKRYRPIEALLKCDITFISKLYLWVANMFLCVYHNCNCGFFSSTWVNKNVVQQMKQQPSKDIGMFIQYIIQLWNNVIAKWHFNYSPASL